MKEGKRRWKPSQGEHRRQAQVSLHVEAAIVNNVHLLTLMFFFSKQSLWCFVLRAIQQLGSSRKLCINSYNQGEPGSIPLSVSTRYLKYKHVHESKKGIPDDSTPMQASIVVKGKPRTGRASAPLSGSEVVEGEMKW